MMNKTALKAVFFDIDGTLIDSNDAHTRAWMQTLQRHGHSVSYETIRRLIGEGSDKVFAELLGIESDSALAKQITHDRTQLLLNSFIPNLKPTPGARELVQRLRSEGLRLVIASSSGEELPALLAQADLQDLLDTAVSSDEVKASKPDGDIIEVALRKAGVHPTEAVMVGDTPYDMAAAKAAGVKGIALRCGGYWDDAAFSDAAVIFDDPATLLRHWTDASLAG
ncbi:HAD family hydrolase [Herbaspirillum sp. SJZ107]|uniref:HAD family hydrolase n=1 Tax=Herbaspirillum sp. SJZ107 TaxID=2572881 RepID=UPI0011519C64|nr:HAD family hydrolase [Herbaspirillum sp. SJZ107]TQK03500.1 HAD superfamily hydrolase (TIGR01509 family)/HAD superfamily hydrolase (TIGR01549 family) [Herbaspirillum sp. SJZ107]